MQFKSAVCWPSVAPAASSARQAPRVSTGQRRKTSGPHRPKPSRAPHVQLPRAPAGWPRCCVVWVHNGAQASRGAGIDVGSRNIVVVPLVAHMPRVLGDHRLRRLHRLSGGFVRPRPKSRTRMVSVCHFPVILVSEVAERPRGLVVRGAVVRDGAVGRKHDTAHQRRRTRRDSRGAHAVHTQRGWAKLRADGRRRSCLTVEASGRVP
jgi:hypothetical protein